MRPLNVRQAAEMLGLQQSTVYNLCERRLLKHRRVGPGKGRIQIEPEWIREYQRSCEIEARDPDATPTPDADASPRVVKGTTIPRYVFLRDRGRDRPQVAHDAPLPPNARAAQTDANRPVKSS